MQRFPKRNEQGLFTAEVAENAKQLLWPRIYADYHGSSDNCFGAKILTATKSF